jgi:hypothetical protein
MIAVGTQGGMREGKQRGPVCGYNGPAADVGSWGPRRRLGRGPGRPGEPEPRRRDAWRARSAALRGGVTGGKAVGGVWGRARRRGAGR